MATVSKVMMAYTNHGKVKGKGKGKAFPLQA
jgi:hypothetical protein